MKSPNPKKNRVKEIKMIKQKTKKMKIRRKNRNPHQGLVQDPKITPKNLDPLLQNPPVQDLVNLLKNLFQRKKKLMITGQKKKI